MNTWLLPRSELTPEQLRVVEMSTAEHRVIAGPPGSGKTQILVHRAAHLVETYNVQPGRYRIFVFTNVIKEYIRSALKLLRLPEEAVSTFDHWCRLVYEAGISRRLPRAGGGRTINFGQIRTAVLRLLQESASLQKQLDFVLVDEGQDLSGEVNEILRLAAQHIRPRRVDANKRIARQLLAPADTLQQERRTAPSGQFQVDGNRECGGLEARGPGNHQRGAEFSQRPGPGEDGPA